MPPQTRSVRCMSMNFITIISCIVLIFFTGCASSFPAPNSLSEPDSKIISLLETGNYNEAMRQLPAEMKAWAEYTKDTGNSQEGAAGFIYPTTIGRIAATGDSDWGKIIDDPDIPYEYKTELIYEILETRLGKGAAWSPWHTDVVIVPRTNTIDSWEVVNQLLKQVISEQGN